MTIITKPMSGNKEDKDKLEPLTAVTSEEPPLARVVAAAAASLTAQRALALRRKRLLTSVLLMLTTLIALCFLFVASLHMLRQMRYQRIRRGHCFVPAPTFWTGAKLEQPATGGREESHSYVSGYFGDFGVSGSEPRPREPLDPEDQGFLVFEPEDEQSKKSLTEAERQLTRETEAQLAGLKPVFTPRLAAETLTLEERVRPDGFVEFDYEVDLDFEEYESFQMPEIYGGRYLHDFKANKTAIIDPVGGLCFILPLDRSEVPEPKNLMEIIDSFRFRKYDIDLEEVRHDTRVVLPPITNLETGYGKLIPPACGDKLTFRLERVTEAPQKVKRSVSPGAMAAKGQDEELDFVEFTGQKMVQYHIVNPEVLAVYKRA